MEKKYEPVAQVTPSLLPAVLPKPTPEGKKEPSMKEREKLVEILLSSTRLSWCEDASVLQTVLLKQKLMRSVTPIRDPHALPQPNLLAETTTSTPTSCLTRVSLRSLR